MHALSFAFELLTATVKIGSMHRNKQPYSSNLPSFAPTGKLAKWYPNGVNLDVTAFKAPISRNVFMADFILASSGISIAFDKNVVGVFSVSFMMYI